MKDLSWLVCLFARFCYHVADVLLARLCGLVHIVPLPSLPSVVSQPAGRQRNTRTLQKTSQNFDGLRGVEDGSTKNNPKILPIKGMWKPFF